MRRQKLLDAVCRKIGMLLGGIFRRESVEHSQKRQSSVEEVAADVTFADDNEGIVSFHHRKLNANVDKWRLSAQRLIADVNAAQRVSWEF